MQNPSYVTVHPSGRYLYAVNETGSFGGGDGGGVSAFAIESALAHWLRCSAAPDDGDPYVTTDASGRFAVVANYSGGSVAVLPIAEDGALQEASGASSCAPAPA